MSPTTQDDRVPARWPMWAQVAAMRATPPAGKRTGHNGPHGGSALHSAKLEVALLDALRMGYNGATALAAHTGHPRSAVKSSLTKLTNVGVLCSHKTAGGTVYSINPEQE